MKEDTRNEIQDIVIIFGLSGAASTAMATGNILLPAMSAGALIIVGCVILQIIFRRNKHANKEG